ncbi:MAG: MarR family transcriptional regulator [Actinomycetota bacterium]|nr:MarR family transcriptional regulator [Actinomycetota bacterium]
MTGEGQGAEAQLVEELAHAFGAFGVPRMAGRILGRLLVSAEAYETLDSLADALGASKGSMSTMARLLAASGLIERVAVPGGRRDHYRIRAGAWPELNRDRVEALARLGAVASMAQLDDLADFCGRAEQELRGSAAAP